MDDWRKRIAMKTNDTAERQVIRRIERGWISQNAKGRKVRTGEHDFDLRESEEGDCHQTAAASDALMMRSSESGGRVI